MKIQKPFDENTLNLPKSKLFFLYTVTQIWFLFFVSESLLGILWPSQGSRTGANKTPGSSKILSIKRMVSQHLPISLCKRLPCSRDLDLSFPLSLNGVSQPVLAQAIQEQHVYLWTWPTSCFASSCYCQSALLQWLLSCMLLPWVFFIRKK